MDLKTASSGDMSKKKAPKGAFYGPAGGSFVQKKKVVLGNIKHSGNERDIFLSKSEPSDSVYSNVNSLSGDNENVGITGVYGGSLLGLAATTPKVKHVDTGTMFDSPLGSSDFTMDDDEIVLPFRSMEKTASLARENNIIVNSDLKRQGICSDQAVVIKEILMDMPKDMIVAAVTEFGEIKSIKVQLIGLWQKAVVEDCFRALLFTLSVRTTAHDLSNLLDNTGGKTCIINHFLDTGNRVHCAVVGFESKNDLDSAFLTEPVLGGVCLSWARLNLVQCRKCGRLGHLALECDMSDMPPSELLSLFNKKHAPGVDHFQLAKLYAKKNVVFFASTSSGSPSGSDLGVGLFLFATSGLGGSSLFSTINDSFLNAHLASLEHSLELLAKQVSGIVRKLSFVELVPLVLSAGASPLVGSAPLVSVLNSDMALDGELVSFTPYPLSADLGAGFSSSSLKVLTIKMGGLESKMLALEASVNSVLARLDLLSCNVQGINIPVKQVDVLHWHVESGLMVSFVTETKLRSSIGPWIKDKFDGVQAFTFGLDVSFLNAGVAIIMNNFLAHHVSKVEEVPGWVIVVWLLFRNKLLVSVIGLYASASSGIHFGQASVVNSLIAKTINSSTFVVFGGDFNENRSGKSTNLKFCLGNSRGIEKIIDFIFVNENLVSAVAGYRVGSISDFFNTNHNAVMVSIGLGGLLNVHLNSLHCSFAMILDIIDEFYVTAAELNLDVMWSLLKKMLVNSANRTFFRCWFNEFQCSKNKHSSKFLGLELLIVKIVKKFGSANTSDFDCLVRKWSTLNADKALVLVDMVQSSQKKVNILKFLSIIKRGYRKSKMYESKLLQEASIRDAIGKCMEKFCSDKGSMIRSVLDQPFQKVVLDYLVVNDEFVLELEKYTPLAHIKDDTFSGIMSAVSLNELLLVIGDLPMGTSTQSPVFAVGSVVKDALEKNRELWLVLQDMHKAYDSVGWHYLRANLCCIKMCERFIGFFGGIHTDRVNRVMTDFGFSGGYRVHDGLDQSKVFSSLLWKIFYDPFLCEIKRHKHLCGYCVDTKFMAKTGRIENSGGMTSFFAAGTFVDNTIWIGDCQASMQYALNIAMHLPCDFPDSVLYHPLLYGLKSFEQVQFEGKMASLVSFANVSGILGHLFEHRFLDLQVLGWAFLDSFQFPVKLCVNSVNNFLAGVVKIFLDNNLSLVNNIPSAFCHPGHFPMSLILGKSLYFSSVQSLKCFGVAFDLRGPVPYWFAVTSKFFLDQGFSSPGFTSNVLSSGLSIMGSDVFSSVQDGLHEIWSGCFEVYMDGFLRSAGSVDVSSGAAAYFLALNLSIGVRVFGLLSSTMAKLQAVALALECVLSSCSLVLHLNSQAAIDACISELLFLIPDFHNCCWIERRHIFNLIRDKDLSVSWVKVKGHASVLGNVRADKFASEAVGSSFVLPIRI
ncbi:hypothetical protein G9A89_020151 [Geosiphon pyriformis]|nr:hypothetical protein G9A89_020151 [Geosiphon pyriformis]